jgi:hypothetical protein
MVVIPTVTMLGVLLLELGQQVILVAAAVEAGSTDLFIVPVSIRAAEEAEALLGMLVMGASADVIITRTQVVPAEAAEAAQAAVAVA